MKTGLVISLNFADYIQTTWSQVSYYAEGLLLWIAFIVLVSGILIRCSFFLISLIHGFRQHPNRPYLFRWLGRGVRVLLPFYKGALKKPGYTFLRYIFHACLLIVPIWFSGHIELWESSWLEWYWTPIPDAWADWMTLMLLVLCLIFIFRRFVIRAVRRDSSVTDFIIIVVVGLPFLSGYALTHGTFENVIFFGGYDNLLALHILSAEMMMILAVFLFCVTSLKLDRCTGCAACVENCPTETLAFADSNGLRSLYYSHYQCIACGSCVYACPENAAELRHSLQLKHFFSIFKRKKLHQVQLVRCDHCGEFFFPTPQMQKIESILNEIRHDGNFLNQCRRCRQIKVGSIASFRELSDFQETQKEDASYGP